MNKRERFLNVLANKPVDRVPVAMFHHFTTYEEWLTGLERPDVFERNIDGHRKSREVFDPDVEHSTHLQEIFSCLRYFKEFNLAL